jgi:hypothetical protein
MRGDEKRVVDAFVAWLEENGWTTDTEVNFVDVCARRGDERLYAEAKGRTAAVGLDVDTLYGQLLRRMADPGAGARYAVVVPTAAIPAVQGGPATASAMPSRVFCARRRLWPAGCVRVRAPARTRV